MNIKLTAQHLFITHKEAEVLYFTVDGQAFFEKEKAAHHSTRLKDKAIVDIYRNAEARQTIKKQEADEQQQRDQTYARLFPELANSVKQNTKNPKR